MADLARSLLSEEIRSLQQARRSGILAVTQGTIAKALYNVWQALAHWIRSDDELVGNAVEDDIVGTFYPGYNWFVKGENNVTNGWINLEMR